MNRDKHNSLNWNIENIENLIFFEFLKKIKIIV